MATRLRAVWRVQPTARRFLVGVSALGPTWRTLRTQRVSLLLTRARRSRASLRVLGGRTPVMTMACLRKWVLASAINISRRAVACALPLHLRARRCAFKRRVVGGGVQVRRSIRAALRLRHRSVLRAVLAEVATTRTIQCHRRRRLVFHQRHRMSPSLARRLLPLVPLAKHLGRSTASVCASRLAVIARRLRMPLATGTRKRITVMEVRQRAPQVGRRSVQKVNARRRRTIRM